MILAAGCVSASGMTPAADVPLPAIGPGTALPGVCAREAGANNEALANVAAASRLVLLGAARSGGELRGANARRAFPADCL